MFVFFFLKYSDFVFFFKKKTFRKTIVDALHELERARESISEAENPDMFLMPIESIYKVRGIGTVVAGRIVQGYVDFYIFEKVI